MSGNRRLLLAAALALPGPARADGGLALRENLFASAAPKLGAPAESSWLSASFLRGWLEGTGGPWRWELALEARAVRSSSGGVGAARSGGSLFGRGGVPERLDLTLDPVRGESFVLRGRVERLKLSRSLGRADLDVGRQPVTLGTGHLIGVLDVVAPFPPGDLDASYKPGVDAVRLRAPLGSRAEAELIEVFDEPWADSASVARLRFPVGGLDLEWVAGRFRRRAFGGVGWEGDAGPLGAWGEAALFERRLEKEAVRGGGRFAAFSAAAGADWRPAPDTLLGGAFFYQDFGASAPSELPLVALDAPFVEGWAFLASRAYLAASFHHEPHPLVRTDLAAWLNLVDGSTLWQPRLTVSLSDEADLSLYGWVAAGKGPDAFGLPRSEFGSAADGAGTYLRVYF